MSGAAIRELEAGLAKIEAQNETLTTFITVIEAQARADAEAADASSRLMVLHMVRRVRPFCVLALPANLVACVLWSAASG